METVNGKWIMLGYSEDDPDFLRTPNDLIYFVHRLGFLLLFSNAVSGFSVEGHTLAENYWTGGTAGTVYGKFFNQRAGYISKAWMLLD